MSELEGLLQGLGLGHYAQAFLRNEVDLEAARLLGDADFAELGIPLGPRRKIQAALKSAADKAGASSAMPGAERRQLTVLFCDLVGSTALSQRLDPEELRALIRTYQDACAGAVSRFGGHVAQFLGDGVLAYFGYPVALEAGAESAVRAGLAIQARLDDLALESAARAGGDLERLRARVGIDTGLVVIGHSAAGNEQDRTAIGDAPNIAARLQALAAPGAVVASGRTHSLAAAAFDWQDLGAHTLSGIAEAVPVWRVSGERSTETRFDAHAGPSLAPMVGRDREFAVVMSAWEQAKAGRSGAILLSGDPGIGKSRILRALREQARSEGVSAAQYQCSPHHINSDLYPIIAHLERLLGFQRDDTPEARLERLDALVRRQSGLSTTAAHLLARMLALPAEARYGALPNLSPQKQKDETIRALVDLVAVAGRDGPVLLLFEDAHWADPSSLEVLSALVARLRELRILMVLTHRPEFQAAWSGQEEVLALTLGRLDPEGVREVATRVAGGRPLPPPLLAHIVGKTDGVPLFVEELTKALLESGAVQSTAAGWELTGSLEEPAIPSTLRDSLMLRLDRLAPIKETAQIGACIGREFSDELIAQVSPLSRRELDRALDQLVAAELLFRRDEAQGVVHVFKHALVQDAAYDSLLRSRRAQLHARIAEVLDGASAESPAANPEVVAHHYQRAGLLPQAAEAWTRAARLAFGRFALPEAVAHGEKAIEAAMAIADPTLRDHRELEARAQHGMTWMALGGWFNPNVATALQPAWPLAQAQRRFDLYVPILWGLSMHALTEGRTGDSLLWVREMLGAAEVSGDEDLRMVAHMSAVVCHFWHGDLLEAKRHGDAIETRYDRERHGHIVRLTNHDPLTIAGIYASNWLWLLGHPDQALARCRRTAEHAQRIGHWFDIGFNCTVGQCVHEYRGDPGELERRLDEAIQLGIDQGLPFFTHLQGPYCQILLAPHRVDPRPAISAARGILGIYDSLGGRIAAPYFRSRLALALAGTGDLPAALAEIDHCLAQIERPGWEEQSHYPEVLRVAAGLRERAGQADLAEALYRQSLEVARAQSARGWELRTATAYACFLEEAGRGEEALALLQPIYAWFTEGFDTQDLRQARIVLDRLAHRQRTGP